MVRESKHGQTEPSTKVIGKRTELTAKGVFTHVDGDLYEGQWVNDKANGFGTYKHTNGAQYNGEWKDDL